MRVGLTVIGFMPMLPAGRNHARPGEWGMHDVDYEKWQRERDFIEEEMRRLMTGATLGSGQDCRIRRGFFTALVERREAAARRLMEADRLRHRRKWKTPTAAAPRAQDITSLVSQDAIPVTTEEVRL